MNFSIGTYTEPSRSSGQRRPRFDASSDPRPLDGHEPALGHILQVQGLSKRFGPSLAAQSLSFQVAEGEILGVIGPNGAGKTTLLEMLAGHVTPSAGRVVFHGDDITALRARDRARLGIARTVQVPQAYARMTVVDQLRIASTFAAGLQGVHAADSIERTMLICGLERHADTPAGRLPPRLHKRLELARALATRPKLLLVDEIAAGLTAFELGDLVALLRRVRRMGTTVIWIEHLVHAMLSAVDRLMAMGGGRLLAIGEPRRVISMPEVRRMCLAG